MSTRVVPMIHVPDVRGTVEWYEMVGFEFLESHEDEGEMTWAALSFGSSELMLNAGGHATDADRRDVDLYVYSGNVAAAYERLQGLVDVIAPINDTFYGNREFIVRDPNGFWLTFGQPLPAIQRVPEQPNPGGTSRNLVSINPFFIVQDLRASIAYYIERLGFQLDFEGPENDPYYGRVSRDGIGIMLKAILPDVPPCPNRTRHEWARWDAYVYCSDPDALFDELRALGASFVKELSAIDEGLWGFEVTDADGYVLAFARMRDE